MLSTFLRRDRDDVPVLHLSAIQPNCTAKRTSNFWLPVSSDWDTLCSTTVVVLQSTLNPEAPEFQRYGKGISSGSASLINLHAQGSVENFCGKVFSLAVFQSRM
ncbi:uncharacterized protein LOC126425042 isoform X5 [Schistocerca serialis cubense]|uniref:uncharacterized protein LOC126425042 isoform X4 n=1 Tax=Schistocerca serialis cubense TaxID=2023355 RepID=UPI00214ECF0F|nr:uncharacterized protein LOC126425042 isoform X4 [Schistocerca serialis cubense]XP_049943909.1 uncharacterized protein LOC126425042 isoform X5 [Schistocerca serialis cubense]